MLLNYLKKLSKEEMPMEKKKVRYNIVMKFLDFIQNFELEIVFYSNNGQDCEISLKALAKYMKEGCKE